VPVLDDDTCDTLAARVLAAELRLYPLALRLVASGKSRITADGTVHNEAGALPTAPLIVPRLRRVTSKRG
jgi:phosphoribosylglycinamide formyltransferase-1